jgi:hypothetical protein
VDLPAAAWRQLGAVGDPAGLIFCHRFKKQRRRG